MIMLAKRDDDGNRRRRHGPRSAGTAAPASRRPPPLRSRSGRTNGRMRWLNSRSIGVSTVSLDLIERDEPQHRDEAGERPGACVVRGDPSLEGRTRSTTASRGAARSTVTGRRTRACDERLDREEAEPEREAAADAARRTVPSPRRRHMPHERGPALGGELLEVALEARPAAAARRLASAPSRRARVNVEHGASGRDSPRPLPPPRVRDHGCPRPLGCLLKAHGTLAMGARP